jgi:acyl dehydratase
MALNLSLIGSTYNVPEFSYTHRDTILYALGIGANENDLDFLYEGKGPKVYPSFATVGSGMGGEGILKELNIDPFMIIHGGQKVKLHGPIPPAATVTTVAKVAGIYDKGKGALVVLEFVSSIGGKPIFENEVTMFVRGAGGFGGERNPPGEAVAIPARAPDQEVTIQTDAKQALVYRLSGDWNPLHADPAIAQMAGFARPILHGLSTVGSTTRMIQKTLCNDDPAGIKSINVRFSTPVLPGDKLTGRLWIDGKKVFVQVVNEKGEVCLADCLFELN